MKKCVVSWKKFVVWNRKNSVDSDVIILAIKRKKKKKKCTTADMSEYRIFRDVKRSSYGLVETNPVD